MGYSTPPATDQIMAYGVDKPFYKKWWFWALLVGVVGGGGFLVYRVIKKV